MKNRARSLVGWLFPQLDGAMSQTESSVEENIIDATSTDDESKPEEVEISEDEIEFLGEVRGAQAEYKSTVPKISLKNIKEALSNFAGFSPKKEEGSSYAAKNLKRSLHLKLSNKKNCKVNGETTSERGDFILQNPIKKRTKKQEKAKKMKKEKATYFQLLKNTINYFKELVSPSKSKPESIEICESDNDDDVESIPIKRIITRPSNDRIPVTLSDEDHVHDVQLCTRNKFSNFNGKTEGSVSRIVELVDISDDEDEVIIESSIVASKNVSKRQSSVEILESSKDCDKKNTSTDSNSSFGLSEVNRNLEEIVIDDSEEDSDSEDEKYYDSREFVKKECDIIYDSESNLDEDLDESRETYADIDESFDSTSSSLTDEMRREVNEKFTTPASDLVTSAYNIDIRVADLMTLKGLNWLNDEVINFYLSMLIEKNSTEPAYAFSTFFYTRILEGGHKAVARWTRKVDLFSFSIVLIPIHLTMHWCLVCVDMIKQTITYLDSMGGSNPQCLAAIKEYLQREHLVKKGLELSDDFFLLSEARDIPGQRNGSDCGLFVLLYSQALLTGRSLANIDSRDTANTRLRVAWEIINQTIL